MANALEKFYSSFGGLDTRSNKLIQDPKTFRKGSKNFRYNFQDEIQPANGFQHKDSGDGDYHSQGLIPYHYTDLITGKASIQLLGVNGQGQLNRKRYHTLKAHISVPNMVLTYSFYYDEKKKSYIFKFNNTDVLVSKTMTMAQLAASASLVSPIVYFDVLDDKGNVVVGSTQLAYLGDVVIDQEFYTLDSLHESYYWEQVVTPTINEVCFPTTRDFKDDPEYEGISYENRNNKIYLTDGGFPITYDGFAAYRMGMPRTAGSKTGQASSYDGFSLLGGSTGNPALTPNSTYQYKFQLGFVDANGQTILGKVQDSLKIALAAQNVVNIAVPPIKNTDMFPVFACRVDSQWVLDNTNQTFNVQLGHNIKVGMVLRIPVLNTPIGFAGFSYWYALVTSVTASTITVAAPPNNNLRGLINGAYTVAHNQWINAGYTSITNQNKITDPVLKGGTYQLPEVLAGVFVRIFRTGSNSDVFYRLREIELPLDNGLVSPNDKYSWVDEYPDASLSGFTFSSNDGEELPRACKILSSFQETIVQAGRPVDSSLKDQLYPNVYTAGISGWGLTNITEDFRYYYTETMMCDYSSFYWADFLNPEGFPQSGLFEQLVKTNSQDRIRGVMPSKDSLFVLKDYQPALISGDLIGQNINVEILDSNAGCSTHQSVQDIGGTIMWLDRLKGFFMCTAGRLPVHVGYPISDYQQINQNKIDYRKVRSANFKKETMYFCSYGKETFVFDYSETEKDNRSCWYLWDRIDTKDMCILDEKLMLTDGSRLWQIKTTNTKYDFSDDVNAVDFEIITAWYNAGLPTIDKNFLFFWLNSVQGDFRVSIDQYNNYLDNKVADLCSVNFLKEDSCKVAVKESVKANRHKISSISFGIRNNDVNAFVRIQGYEIQLDGSYDRSDAKQ